ncbi:hypothetical protein DXV76_20960 [Rhodobacteraceae bacterium CCMM004]|nr:hypothetical protein DXV76_20960 [Rhodobacteraceae bacterium CCMM004]
MAIYHLHARFVKRSEGRSSVAAAAYRAGEKLRDERQGQTFDFRHKAGQVQHAALLLPEGAPEHLRDRAALWNEVERVNKRKDAQPAFEIELALPRELSHADRVRLAETFARRTFVAEGLAVDLCIHNIPASDGGEHPHCHCLVTTRRIEGDSFGKVARDLQDNPAVLRRVYALEQAGQLDEALLEEKGTHLAAWRAGWAAICNDFLDEAGHAERIDHRTLAAQKIEREATPNIGFAFHREFDGLRGWLADRVEALKGVQWRNSLRHQFDRIRETRSDLTAEFIAHAREYAKDLLDGLSPSEKGREPDYER